MEPPKKLEPTPFEKFDALTKKVISVPRAEILKREVQWKKERAEHRKPSSSKLHIP